MLVREEIQCEWRWYNVYILHSAYEHKYSPDLSLLNSGEKCYVNESFRTPNMIFSR